MDYNILLGLLISYSIIYFIVRPYLPKKKAVFAVFGKTIKFNPYTLITHALLNLVFLFNILSPINIFILLAYLIINLIIDEAAEPLYAKTQNSISAVYLFLVDKLIGLLLIFVTSYAVEINIPKQATLIIINNFFANIFSLFHTQITYQNKLLIAIFLVVIGLWGAGKFIALLIDSINKAGGTKSPEILKAGFLIGILERSFIICSILLGMSQVIGFVLAAKSVARLSKLNDDRFVEIFIIGNFVSFLTAIVIGAIIKNLNIFPYLINTIE